MLSRCSHPAVADLLMDLPRSNTAAAVGRRALRRMLTDADAHELAADAELALSELITNAVLFTSGTVRLSARFRADSGMLRVKVADDDPRAPGAGTSPSAGASLAVVGAVTTAWGWDADENGTGKIVWFELQQYRPAGRLLA